MDRRSLMLFITLLLISMMLYTSLLNKSPHLYSYESDILLSHTLTSTLFTYVANRIDSKRCAPMSKDTFLGFIHALSVFAGIISMVRIGVVQTMIMFIVCDPIITLSSTKFITPYQKFPHLIPSSLSVFSMFIFSISIFLASFHLAHFQLSNLLYLITPVLLSSIRNVMSYKQFSSTPNSTITTANVGTPKKNMQTYALSTMYSSSVHDILYQSLITNSLPWSIVLTFLSHVYNNTTLSLPSSSTVFTITKLGIYLSTFHYVSIGILLSCAPFVHSAIHSFINLPVIIIILLSTSATLTTQSWSESLPFLTVAVGTVITFGIAQSIKRGHVDSLRVKRLLFLASLIAVTGLVVVESVIHGRLKKMNDHSLIFKASSKTQHPHSSIHLNSKDMLLPNSIPPPITTTYQIQQPSFRAMSLSSSSSALASASSISASTSKQHDKQIMEGAPRGAFFHILEHFYNGPSLSNITLTDYNNTLVPPSFVDTLWQYASTAKIVTFTPGRTRTCGIEYSAETCIARALIRTSTPTSHVVVHLPLAEYLTPAHVMYIDRIREFARNENVARVIVTGLGAALRKMPHDIVNSSNYLRNGDLSIYGRVDDANQINNTFKLDSVVQESIQKLNGLPIDLLVRGSVTETLIRNAGFTNVISTGCPSLWISDNIKLGETLQRNTQLLPSSFTNSSKIIVSMRAFKGYFRILKLIHSTYPNHVTFIAQTSWDLRNLRELRIPLSQVRVPAGIAQWVNVLKGAHVVLAGRVQVALMASMLNIPSLVMAPDLAAVELARCVKLPFVTPGDMKRLQDEHKGIIFDVVKMVKTFIINGKEFDQNRCEIAKVYDRVYGRVGLDVMPHVKSITEQC